MNGNGKWNTDMEDMEPPDRMHSRSAIESGNGTGIRDKSNGQTTRTYVVVVVIVVLLVSWLLLVRYGGEARSVGVLERGFSGVSVEEGDTVEIAVVSGDEPLTVYGTSKDKFSESSTESLEYLKNQRYRLNPNDRGVVEYTAPSDGIWGIAVEGPGDCRVNYRVQVVKPPIIGHIRYTFIPFYVILVLAATLPVADYVESRKQKRMREYERRRLEGLERIDELDDQLSKLEAQED